VSLVFEPADVRNPSPSMTELIIDANTRIQILDKVEHLARGRKHQYAAFIRSEEVLCVWSDHVEAVIPAAESLEESLIQFIWRGEEENKKMNQAMMIDEENEKAEKASSFDEDTEDAAMRRLKRHWRERPVVLWAPVSDGLAIMLCMGIISLGGSESSLGTKLTAGKLVQEYLLDGKYLRFLLLLIVPPLFFIASFACLCLVGSIVSCYGDSTDGSSKSSGRSDRSPPILASSVVSPRRGPWASWHTSPCKCQCTRSHWRRSSCRQSRHSNARSPREITIEAELTAGMNGRAGASAFSFAMMVYSYSRKQRQINDGLSTLTTTSPTSLGRDTK